MLFLTALVVGFFVGDNVWDNTKMDFKKQVVLNTNQTRIQAYSVAYIQSAGTR
jgi:hypothetical protein